MTRCKSCGSKTGAKMVVHKKCGNSGCNGDVQNARDRNSCGAALIHIDSGGVKTCNKCKKQIYGNSDLTYL